MRKLKTSRNKYNILLCYSKKIEMYETSSAARRNKRDVPASSLKVDHSLLSLWFMQTFVFESGCMTGKVKRKDKEKNDSV